MNLPRVHLSINNINTVLYISILAGVHAAYYFVVCFHHDNFRFSSFFHMLHDWATFLYPTSFWGTDKLFLLLENCYCNTILVHIWKSFSMERARSGAFEFYIIFTSISLHFFTQALWIWIPVSSYDCQIWCY